MYSVGDKRSSGINLISQCDRLWFIGHSSGSVVGALKYDSRL